MSLRCPEVAGRGAVLSGSARQVVRTQSQTCSNSLRTYVTWCIGAPHNTRCNKPCAVWGENWQGCISLLPLVAAQWARRSQHFWLPFSASPAVTDAASHQVYSPPQLLLKRRHARCVLKLHLSALSPLPVLGSRSGERCKLLGGAAEPSCPVQPQAAVLQANNARKPPCRLIEAQHSPTALPPAQRMGRLGLLPCGASCRRRCRAVANCPGPQPLLQSFCVDCSAGNRPQQMTVGSVELQMAMAQQQQQHAALALPWAAEHQAWQQREAQYREQARPGLAFIITNIFKVPL